jgi:LytS/YehU family sensor histidine kinase
VENAIRHGMNLVSMRFDISVKGRLERGGLTLAVRDHGPGLPIGLPPDRLTRGIGLRNTAERLERLYGERQSVRIENADGGGTLVELRVPLR